MPEGYRGRRTTARELTGGPLLVGTVHGARSRMQRRHGSRQRSGKCMRPRPATSSPRYCRSARGCSALSAPLPRPPAPTLSTGLGRQTVRPDNEDLPGIARSAADARRSETASHSGDQHVHDHSGADAAQLALPNTCPRSSPAKKSVLVRRVHRAVLETARALDRVAWSPSGLAQLMAGPHAKGPMRVGISWTVLRSPPAARRRRYPTRLVWRSELVLSHRDGRPGTRSVPGAPVAALGVKPPPPDDRSPLRDAALRTITARRRGRRATAGTAGTPIRGGARRPAATTWDRRDGHVMATKGRSRTGHRAPLTNEEERSQRDAERREKLEALHEQFTAQVAELVDGSDGGRCWRPPDAFISTASATSCSSSRRIQRKPGSPDIARGRASVARCARESGGSRSSRL